MNDLSVALAILVCIATCVLIYAVILLSRIAHGMTDVRERLDDVKLRLGVLDPGETKVNPLNQVYPTAPIKVPPPNAPDETLPGNG